MPAALAHLMLYPEADSIPLQTSSDADPAPLGHWRRSDPRNILLNGMLESDGLKGVEEPR